MSMSHFQHKVQKDSKLNTSRGKIDQQHIHQSSPDSGVPKYLAKHINSKISNEIPSLLLTYGKRENWFVPSADIKMENKPIAAGNCAQIYRGFFRGIQVVIKQITDRENQHDVKDIRREIALWRTLRHPNIVMFLELRLEEALDIAISIGQAVAYLHGNRPPIIHREFELIYFWYIVDLIRKDLKPDNIMFGSGGQNIDCFPLSKVSLRHNRKAKLGDFGLARIRASKKMDRGYKMTGRTGFSLNPSSMMKRFIRINLIKNIERLVSIDFDMGHRFSYSRCEREDFARKRQNFKEAVLAHNYSRPKAIDFVYNLQQYALNQDKEAEKIMRSFLFKSLRVFNLTIL
eukprot:jgi/Bigna1/69916/fgenesh1_pg.10_\